MEINIPTASPFFTGISNQIMYCISTPNLPAWNTGATFTTDHQKKPENQSIIQPLGNTQNPTNQVATAQYYYGNTNTAITQNIQAFNQTYPVPNIHPQPQQQQQVASNEQNKSQQDRDHRFFNGDGRAFECSVVKLRLLISCFTIFFN